MKYKSFKILQFLSALLLTGTAFSAENLYNATIPREYGYFSGTKVCEKVSEPRDIVNTRRLDLFGARFYFPSSFKPYAAMGRLDSELNIMIYDTEAEDIGFFLILNAEGPPLGGYRLIDFVVSVALGEVDEDYSVTDMTKFQDSNLQMFQFNIRSGRNSGAFEQFVYPEVSDIIAFSQVDHDDGSAMHNALVFLRYLQTDRVIAIDSYNILNCGMIESAATPTDIDEFEWGEALRDFTSDFIERDVVNLDVAKAFFDTQALYNEFVENQALIAASEKPDVTMNARSLGLLADILDGVSLHPTEKDNVIVSKEFKRAVGLLQEMVDGGSEISPEFLQVMREAGRLFDQ